MTCFSLDDLSRMTGERIALHRTGGRCACGCGQLADECRLVFPPERWPELAGHPDNAVALASGHKGVYLPRRVVRHAERLAESGEMRDYLTAHYPSLARG